MSSISHALSDDDSKMDVIDQEIDEIIDENEIMDFGAQSDSEASGVPEDEDLRADRLPLNVPQAGNQERWSKHYQPVERHPFIPAQRRPLPEGLLTPLDCFLLLFPQDLFEKITQRTNEHASVLHSLDLEGAQRTRLRTQNLERIQERWTPTTVDEMKAYVGVHIIMGYRYCRDFRMHWDSSETTSSIADVFPLTRFIQLDRYFYVAEHAETEDRLQKLRDFSDDLRNNFQEYFYPSQFLTIDEAMIPFQGRSCMRQRIASKTHNTGFKLWAIVDTESTYLFDFDIYTGRRDDRTVVGETAAVANKLLAKIDKNRWHVVCMDGYFSSIPLFRQLLSNGFYAVGTFRINRKGFPKRLLLKRRRLSPGEWKFSQNKTTRELSCVAWMQDKPVNILSSFDDPTAEASVKRRGHRMGCPQVVVTYNKNMRGVDVFAQKQSYYAIFRIHRKYYYRIIWFLIDAAIMNAHILYGGSSKISSIDFRKELAKQLIGGNSFRHRSRSSQNNERENPNDNRIMTPHHSPAYSNVHRDCAICTTGAGPGRPRHRVKTICQKCNLHICLGECYEIHLAQSEAI